LTLTRLFAKLTCGLTKMIFLKFITGIFFLFLGWIFFFKPNLVASVNEFAREKIFNDRIILLERKKLAALFFLIAVVAVYMTFLSVIEHITVYSGGRWKQQANQYLMYMAMKDYFGRRYDSALEKYGKILLTEPNNIEALTRMATIYQATGDKKRASVIFSRLLMINKANSTIKDIK
jgi:hypothetical protein